VKIADSSNTDFDEYIKSTVDLRSVYTVCEQVTKLK